MTGTNKPPSAARILSILVDLYADQMGVKVKYQIETSEETEVVHE